MVPFITRNAQNPPGGGVNPPCDGGVNPPPVGGENPPPVGGENPPPVGGAGAAQEGSALGNGKQRLLTLLRELKERPARTVTRAQRSGVATPITINNCTVVFQMSHHLVRAGVVGPRSEIVPRAGCPAGCRERPRCRGAAMDLSAM